jgi:hypothetical protein
MTTRAELAFKALDKDNSGYITGIRGTTYNLQVYVGQHLHKKIASSVALFYKVTFGGWVGRGDGVRYSNTSSIVRL